MEPSMAHPTTWTNQLCCLTFKISWMRERSHESLIGAADFLPNVP